MIPPSFAAGILVLALLTSLVARIAGWILPPPPSAPAAAVACPTSVAMTVSSEDAWQATVVHLLERARAPRALTIHVFVECATLDDALASHATLQVPSELRTRVAVRHVRQSRGGHLGRMLARGSAGGTAVVVLLGGAHVRLCAGWDERVAALVRDRTVLTAPLGRGFPTLAAPGVLGPPRPFAPLPPLSRHDLLVARSVCVCREFVALTTETASLLRQQLDWSALDDWVVPLVPLLDVDEDEGRLRAGPPWATRECSVWTKLGLVDADDLDDCLAKFGSSEVSSIAKSFSSSSDE